MIVIAYILIAVLGAAFGSFFNVCIYRLPKRESIAFPASHCPVCNTPIKPWNNIPVISYLILRGRCPDCGTKIHWHYPLLEALTPLVFMLLFHRFGESFGFEFWKFTVFFAVSLILLFIDLFHQLLPDVLTLPLIVLGFALSWLPKSEIEPMSSLGGGVFGFAFFLLLAWGYSRVRGREGLGGGDIKYVAAMGVFLGMPGIMFAILFGSLIALISAPVMLMRQKEDSGSLASRVFPFGPFLVLGALLQVMTGDAVLHAYISLLPY